MIRVDGARYGRDDAGGRALAVRMLNPGRLVVAVPVAAEQTCDQFRDVVDEIVCDVTPRPFRAVGLWYNDFSQTTDDEVRELVGRAAEEAAGYLGGDDGGH